MYDSWGERYGVKRRRWVFGLIVESDNRLRGRIINAMQRELDGINDI